MDIELDIHDIMNYLPHRYPFLLLDRVVAVETGKSITALKNVTVTEPFFQGHFPGRPIMPGVLILEAMAQASGVLAFHTLAQEGFKRSASSLFLLVGIDKARFKRPVTPGDQLMIEVNYLRQTRGVWKFEANSRVDGELCASAELMCAARDVED